MTNILLVILLLIFIVLNNIGGSMMAYVMPKYPSWLLYGTTILYVIGFYFLARYKGEHPFSSHHLSWNQQKQFLILGVLTVANGLCYQFSDPWISGDYAQIISNLGIPSVWFFSLWILKDRFTVKEMLGSLIVFLGVIIGGIPKFSCIIPSANSACNADGTWKHIDQSGHIALQSNPSYMVILFILSVILQSVEQVWQDKSFREPYKVQKATCLFWYNLYSILPYLFTIPLEAVPYLNGSTKSTSVENAFDNQMHAFRCYFNNPYPEDIVLYNTTNGQMIKNCYPLSWLWPTIFVFGYLGMFYLNAVFIDRYNAFYASVLGTMATPLAALVMSSKDIVGKDNYDSLTCYTYISFTIILAGFFIKGKPLEDNEEDNEEDKKENNYNLLHS